jgi:hypothetical protein
VRDAVAALVHLDVVVDTDGGMAPLGVLIGHRRQWPERRAIELLEQRATRAGQLLKGPLVERHQQRGDGTVELGQGEESAVA